MEEYKKFYKKSIAISSPKINSKKFAEPRMSLLGKPLNYRHTHVRDVRFRKIQSEIYNFLERPRGLIAMAYHILMFLMVLICLILSVFATIEKYEKNTSSILYELEVLVLVWFTLEFFVRLWSAGCRSRYQGFMGRFKFMKLPFCVIDMIIIISSLILLAMGSSGHVFATNAMRGLRFFQILRMFRMDRRGGTWKLLGSVIYAHRQELMTTIYIGFLGLTFASFLLYMVEKDTNPGFDNFATALWWGIITLCTIGYGDIVPQTWQGQMIASVCALLGISIFALPAGIIGSGLALKVQQQQRQKHMIRRLQPAAALIQSVWRCYAADKDSTSVATWKIHEEPLNKWTNLKNHGPLAVRLSNFKRHINHSMHLPNGENFWNKSPRSSARFNRPQQDIVVEMENLDENVPFYSQLTNEHKTAIRFLRKLKYFVARRKFKEALKPYDVKDVMEQYAAGHIDLLGKVKIVQLKLDEIIGPKSSDCEVLNISLASRVMRVEKNVTDIQTKLNILLNAYMEDRQKIFSLPSNAPENMISHREKSGNNDDITGNATNTLDKITTLPKEQPAKSRDHNDNSVGNLENSRPSVTFKISQVTQQDIRVTVNQDNRSRKNNHPETKISETKPNDSIAPKDDNDQYEDEEESQC